MTEREQQLETLREHLNGKLVNEAREWCKANGWEFRCRNTDGQSMIGTCDMRMDRVNYTERDGVVTSITSIG